MTVPASRAAVRSLVLQKEQTDVDLAEATDFLTQIANELGIARTSVLALKASVENGTYPITGNDHIASVEQHYGAASTLWGQSPWSKA